MSTRYLFASICLLLASGTGAVSSSGSSPVPGSVTAATPPVAATSSSRTTVKRPDWLDVDRVTMEQYMELAKQRHREAIAKAREAYNVLESPDFFEPDQSLLSQLALKPRIVESSGRLPDFHDELDKKLFVTSPLPLFTPQECQDCIDKAEAHFAQTNQGEWTQLPSGQYNVAGFWIRDIPAVHQWFLQMLQSRLFPLLAQTFPEFCDSSLQDLVVDNAYVFKYTPETGRRTDVHTDSGCLSFTISLNSKDDYEGGGTWFEGLQPDEDHDTTDSGSNSKKSSQVIEMDVGQCTVRPGGVRHCGHAVTQGTRYIIGGFCMHAKKIEYVRMLLGIGSQGNSLKERQTALEVAIALNPGFDGPYTNLADLLYQEGKKEKAKQVLEYCLEHVNPQCGEVAYTLGGIHYEQGSLDQAKKCMERCLQVDDSDVEAMLVMAQISASEGNKQEERQWNERIVGTPGASDKATASAYCNLGVLYEGENLEIEYYHKALALRPELFAPRYSLACAYACREQWDEAAQEFRQALTYGASDDEQEMRAIKAAYQVAQQKIRRDHPQGVTSREAMIQLIQEIIGADNFDKLAAATQR
jgi:tetratricopeptide (TPR) repeat protein